MTDPLHELLNLVLFSPNSDLAWSGVRVVVALAALISAYNMRHDRDLVFYAAWALSIWIALKVFDDVTHIGKGPDLTGYFTVANILWCAILIGIERRAVRRGERGPASERRAIRARGLK